MLNWHGLLIAFASLLLLGSAPGANAASEPAPGTERLHRDGTVLLYISGQEFTLGSEDTVGFSSRPVHRVELTSFWIGKYPVTNEQYRNYLAADPQRVEPEYWHDEEFNQPRQPIVGLSWDEARAYCTWAGMDLPSEAQWEAAARGSDGRSYPWGSEEPTRKLANYDLQLGRTTPVDSFPRGVGPYGTVGQAGNVMEWCLDTWNRKAYEDRAGARDPIGRTGPVADYRVLRGGSWFYPARYLPAAQRVGFPANARYRSIGVRCALSASAER